MNQTIALPNQPAASTMNLLDDVTYLATALFGDEVVVRDGYEPEGEYYFVSVTGGKASLFRTGSTLPWALARMLDTLRSMAEARNANAA